MTREDRTAVEALRDRAAAQKDRGYEDLQMVIRRTRRPPGFPKGELIAEYENVNAYAINCDKLIAWCDKTLKGNAK